MVQWYNRTMKILTFLSQKGGSGKTTLAVHCAVAAMQAGMRVEIADTDPQGSAMLWGLVRGNELPQVVRVQARGLDTLNHKGRNALLVVDSAPHAAPEAAALARASSLVVIPCRPSVFDLDSVASTVSIVRAANTPAVFVLSACPYGAPEIEQARVILAGHGLPIYPGQVTERRVFSRATNSGHTVTETVFNRFSKAADEIRELWAWLRKEL